MKTALLVIDVQESFRYRAYWRDTGVRPFLDRVQRLVDRAQDANIPVLQVFHVNETEGASAPFSRQSGHVRTMEGLRISPTKVFHKNVHSALYARASDGKTLEQWLRDWNIEHVIVTGIRTEQCCETTTRHASDAGFKVTYAMDATLTFPMESPSGRSYSAEEIMDRTELVLAGRFARVVSTEAVAM